MATHTATDLAGLGLHPHLANEVKRICAYSNSNISSSDAPSLAEIVAAFGSAATVGAGYLGIIDDAGAGSNCVLCVSDGTNWFYAALTKAS